MTKHWIGQKASIRRHISKDMVKDFGSLSGDHNPLHFDENFAHSLGFSQPVCHGFLSACFLSCLIGEHLPGHGALWYEQTLTFHQPAFIGDDLLIEGSVTHYNAHQQTMIIEVVIRNQHDVSLITGTTKVKMPQKKKLMHNEKKNDPSQQPILVTGGAGGIGSVTAQHLAKKGHPILLHINRASEKTKLLVENLAKIGPNITVLQADLSDYEDTIKLVKSIIKESLLCTGIVHCASPNLSKEIGFPKTEWSHIEYQYHVQIRSLFLLVKLLCPHWLTHDIKASIVTLSSTVIDAPPVPEWLGYSLAKSTLSTLTQYLAASLGPHQIRINAVAPGMTHTSLIHTISEREKLLQKSKTPLNRLAEPDDIAQTIMFLLSPNARHITGETIRVCGGSVMV